MTSRRERGTQRQTGCIKPAVVSSCFIVPQEKKPEKHMISVSVNHGEPNRICSDSSGSMAEREGSVALPAGAGGAHA